MAVLENRSGVYSPVHEHRKRQKPPFAARTGLNINRPMGEPPSVGIGSGGAAASAPSRPWAGTGIELAADRVRGGSTWNDHALGSSPNAVKEGAARTWIGFTSFPSIHSWCEKRLDCHCRGLSGDVGTGT